MATGFTIGCDAIAANLGRVPSGVQLASYVTQAHPGDGIAMSAGQLAANPGIIRIAQSPLLGADEAPHADVLDMEDLAATLSDCAPWAIDAQSNFDKGTRPGQRRPAIYCSQGKVHDVVNSLVGGGVKSGVGLWLANWSITQSQAIADVMSGSGPFPVIGIQFADPGPFDRDVWSAAWLADVSRAAGQGGTVIAAPPGLSQTCHEGSVTANFSWGLPAGTTVMSRFHFQVREQLSGALVVNQLIAGTHAMNVALKPGTAYQWRVSFEGPLGQWPGWQRFTTP